MNPHDRDIDRILREDRSLAPSGDFSERVMRAVRCEVDRQQGITFPWRRVAWGLGTCAVLTAAGVVAALVRGDPLTLPRGVDAVLERPEVVVATLWVPAILAGSYALVWWSMRLAGYRR